MLTVSGVMGPVHAAFHAADFIPRRGGLEWAGRGEGGGGGSESERGIGDWRVVGRQERGEAAPESFLPVTSLALVPGCAALRSRLGRNHPPRRRAEFHSGLVLLSHAVLGTSQLFYALCAEREG